MGDARVGREQIAVGLTPISEARVGREQIAVGLTPISAARVGRLKIQIAATPLPPAVVEIGAVSLRIAVGKPIVRTCTQQLASTSTTKFIRPAHVWRALNMI